MRMFFCCLNSISQAGRSLFADKTAKRQLKGVSDKKSGCVLDGPFTDTQTDDVLHHVFTNENRQIYVITRIRYKEIIGELVTERRNTRFSVYDETLKVCERRRKLHTKLQLSSFLVWRLYNIQVYDQWRQ